MPASLTLKPDIALGVVPTHVKFVGGLVPGDDGKFPRESDGRLFAVAEMDRICQRSPVRPTCVQISTFPGADESETSEMIVGLQELGLDVHLIMMVGGANPMDPADEDTVVSQLMESLRPALKHKVASVSSTSIEEWMNGPEDVDFDSAIAQNVKLHIRAARESGLLDSDISAWHIEFLRPGEFKTFTNLDKAWSFIKAANKELGRNFFKILIDAAHMGDSGLTIPENQKLISEIAAADHLGIFHASAKPPAAASAQTMAGSAPCSAPPPGPESSKPSSSSSSTTRTTPSKHSAPSNPAMASIPSTAAPTPKPSSTASPMSPAA